MLLAELFDHLPITVIRDGGVRVTDLTEDSRTAMPGSLFIARTGHASDGLAYIGDAVTAGAVAVLTTPDADVAAVPDRVALAVCDDVRLMTARLAERMFGNPSGRLLLAGITGTNGKSTVAHLVHGLLNRCGVRSGVIGTVGVDDGTEFAPSPLTTPPAIELSRTLATMVEAGCQACVMEVSSHALDQRRADGLAFDAAVFTNLSGDHADYHPTPGHYLAAKRRLLGMVPEGGPVVLNADEPDVAQSDPGGRRRVMCALAGAESADADWVVRRGRVSIEGETITIEHAGRSLGATIPLIGPFNAMNAAQAVAVAWELLGQAGVDDQDRWARIGRALSLATAPRGRLEPVHGPGDDVSVFVDFAHTDDALDRALGAVREACTAGTQLTAVFGCGGDRDTSKRPRMGAAAAAHADRIVITSDNPRSEPPERIVSEIMTGIPASRRADVVVLIERGRAIREAIIGARPGGVVVIAGKGHETDQIGVDASGRRATRGFVDQDVARETLAERRRETSRLGARS